MSSINKPKYIKVIEIDVTEKLKVVKKPNCGLIEPYQTYIDQVLEIYREAFKILIKHTITYSLLLSGIKNAYENAIRIRDKRISQYIIQDKVFGITVRKQQRDDNMRCLLKENGDLKGEILKLKVEISKLQKEPAKVCEDGLTWFSVPCEHNV